VDILVVVLEIVQDDDEQYALYRPQRRDGSYGCDCRISIVDHSFFPSQHPVSFAWFYGKRKRDWIVQELKLRKGDVIRLHRVQIEQQQQPQNNNHHVHVSSLYNSETDNTNVYHFHPSSQNDSGPDMTRLCHVDCSTGRVIGNTTTTDRDSSSSSKILSGLITWFLKSEYRTNMATTYHQQQRGLDLHSLPCQYRSLFQLYHTSRGVMSHVIATVLQIQDDAPIVRVDARSASSATVRKKQRRSNSRIVPKPTRILLTDGTTTVMTFYLDNTLIQHQSFRETLQSALQDNRWVRLMRVLSQTAFRCAVPVSKRTYCSTRTAATTSHGDEVFLVPTTDTDIVFTQEPKLEHQPEQSPELSQPSSSKMHSAGCPDQPFLSSFTTRRWQIRSSILDIRVKGVSIVQSKNNSTQSMCTSLNQLLRSQHGQMNENNSHSSKNTFQDYSECVIEFCSNHDCALEAIADGNIVRILCGGLDLEEWSRKSSPFGPMIVNMIQSLVYEKIE
jgi:hypothetical protein